MGNVDFEEGGSTDNVTYKVRSIRVTEVELTISSLYG